MRCPTCDYELPNDSSVVFCPNCGARISRTPEASSGGSFSLPPAVTPTYGTPAQQVYAPEVSQLPQQSLPVGSYSAAMPNSTAAIVSLVFGILSWVMLPFVGAIVAVVAGHVARREIANAHQPLGGRGLATAGLILGYVNIALCVIGICLFVLLIGIAASSAG